MRFFRYVKSIGWELFLCVAMVDGLGVPLMRWFYTEEALSCTLLRLTLTALALLALLYFGSYHKIALVVSGLSALVVILSLNLLLPVPKLILIQNAAALLQLVFWYLVGILLTLLLYLSTLTPFGTAAVFFLGTVASGLLMLLDIQFPLGVFLLFLWSCASLYFFRRHEKLAMEEGDTPASLVMVTAVFCGICLLLGGIVWQGVISPLDYETRTLPFQQEAVQESVSPQPEEAPIPSASPTPSIIPEEENPFPDEALNGNGDDGPETTGEPSFLLLIFVLLVILILFYPNLRRRLWLWQLSKLPSGQQAQRCYLRLQRQFSALGISSVDAFTPEEYASLVTDAYPWLNKIGRGWSRLTADYCEALYGGQADARLTAELLRFHRGFYPVCRKHLGWRYLYLRYFLI